MPPATSNPGSASIWDVMGLILGRDRPAVVKSLKKRIHYYQFESLWFESSPTFRMASGPSAAYL